MRFAVIPWDESLKQDSIFKEKGSGYVDSHILLRRAFEADKHELHTIDIYSDLTEVDCFLFFTINLHWLKKLIKKGLEKKMVYCSGEPAVVKPLNCKEGYEVLKRIFPYIMTWDDDLVDNQRIFKRNIPYCFSKHYGNTPFSERKLLVNMSGNKRSQHPKELYSERERVVSYFEEKYPDEFELYGTGWDKTIHSSYKGISKDKDETYSHFKFALSLENTWDVRGYITEKMFDCFTSGIVPVYQGAKDIDEYVPKECYIDYQRFSSLDELAEFLSGMDEKAYREYLSAIDRFLDSDGRKPFGSDVFCKDIYDVLLHGQPGNFAVSGQDKRSIQRKALVQDVQDVISNSKIKIKKVLGR